MAVIESPLRSPIKEGYRDPRSRLSMPQEPDKKVVVITGGHGFIVRTSFRPIPKSEGDTL